MSDVYVCMHKHAKLGGSSPPGKFIRCSEFAFEGQKQSCSSYMARGVLHPIFGCPRMHLLSQLTSNFQERRC